MAKIGKPESSICGSDAEANVSILYAVILTLWMLITLFLEEVVELTEMTVSPTFRHCADTTTTLLTGENRDGRKEQARNAV